MSAFTYSVSMIIPAESLDDARNLAWALGHDEPSLATFSAELSTDGTEITHYGAHTYARQEFIDILEAAQSGTLPPIRWADYGLTQRKVLGVLAAMTVVYAQGRVDDTWPRAVVDAGVQAVQWTI